MVKNLLLRIRTEALHANLIKVKDYLDNVPDRKTDLDHLLEELGKSREVALTTKNATHNAKEILADENEHSKALPELEKAVEAIKKAFDGIKSAQEMIRGMQ